MDVGRPADEGVDVFCGVEIEVYVDSMDDLVSDYAVDHLLLEPASAVVLVGIADSCRMPRHVAVLAAAQQDDLLEVVKVAGLAQLEEEGVFEGLRVFHCELVQAFDLVHLPHEPHSRLYHRINTVQVTQVWSAKREEEAELAVEMRNVAETSPCDNSAHAVSDKVYYSLAWVLKVALDDIFHLVCEPQAHDLYVSVGVHLVVGGAVDQSSWQHLADFALQHFHVEGACLEAVAEENHHIPLVVRVLFLHFRLPEVGQLS